MGEIGSNYKQIGNYQTKIVVVIFAKEKKTIHTQTYKHTKSLSLNCGLHQSRFVGR